MKFQYRKRKPLWCTFVVTVAEVTRELSYNICGHMHLFCSPFLNCVLQGRQYLKLLIKDIEQFLMKIEEKMLYKLGKVKGRPR